MNSNKKTTSTPVNIGLGAGLGFGLGLVFGGMALPGSPGAVLGGIFGMPIGMVVSMNAGSLGFFPTYSILAIAFGSVAGSAVMLLIGKLAGSEGLTGLGLWFGAAVGLIIGTLLDVRKKRRLTHPSA